MEQRAQLASKNFSCSEHLSLAKHESKATKLAKKNPIDKNITIQLKKEKRSQDSLIEQKLGWPST